MLSVINTTSVDNKIQKIKAKLYILNCAFYISFLAINQNKKYDILFIFFGITIVMFGLDAAYSKSNYFTFLITRLMLVTSLLLFGFFIYLCMDNLYYFWPYIFLYAIIVLHYFMLNNHITINYRNYIVYNLQDKECPVCLEVFNSGYTYTCNHFICETCFNNWIQTNYNFTKCVTCRTGEIYLNNIELNV